MTKAAIPRYGVKEITTVHDDLDVHAEELRIIGYTIIEKKVKGI